MGKIGADPNTNRYLEDLNVGGRDARGLHSTGCHRLFWKQSVTQLQPLSAKMIFPIFRRTCSSLCLVKLIGSSAPLI